MPFQRKGLNAMGSICKEQMEYGLHVDVNGVITLGGKPFYGMGLNYYDGFNRSLHNFDDASYADAMKRLSKAGIPFVRTSFNGYYANTLKIYRDQPEMFFKLADQFIHTAEKYKIGLILSLFWCYFSLPDLMQEPVKQLGNTQSQTMRHAKQFIRDVVTRYRHSPAVWGWEIGNEYNLEADLACVDIYPPVVPDQGTPGIRTKDDQLSSQDIVVFYTQIANEIRKHDSYRMIISGDAIHRECMMHLKHKGIFELDTEKEFAEGVLMFTPYPIDTISTHMYIYDEVRFSPDRIVGIGELLTVYKNIAKNNKKALYFGEFAAFGTDEEGEKKGKQLLPRIFKAIQQADIQLSSPWNFEMQGMTHGSFSDHGIGSFCFEDTVKINQEYTAKGLQDYTNVW